MHIVIASVSAMNASSRICSNLKKNFLLITVTILLVMYD